MSTWFMDEPQQPAAASFFVDLLCYACKGAAQAIHFESVKP